MQCNFLQGFDVLQMAHCSYVVTEKQETVDIFFNSWGVGHKISFFLSSFLLQ